MEPLTRDFSAEHVQVIVLECTTDNHYKYYHLSRNKKSNFYLAQWGRIGNNPQSKEYGVPSDEWTKDYEHDVNNIYVGRAMYDKMLEKLKKGYVLKTYQLFGDHSTGYEEFMAYLKENNTDLDNLLFD